MATQQQLGDSGDHAHSESRRLRCVVLVCDNCIRTLYESDPQIPEKMQNALRRAYTSLNSAPTDHAQPSETES